MEQQEKVRLDKWLWAARFYKTRSLAKEAIDGGKVKYNQQHCKPGKAAELGVELTIRQGWFDKVVIIEALHGKRRSAVLAQEMYQETQDSLEKREQALLQRKQMMGDNIAPVKRPNKRERRHIHRFKNINNE